MNKHRKAGIKIAYGEHLPWNDDKIIRDILQNFYDGNGHTLDGTRISIKRNGDNHKIRISSDSTFSYKHLESLGSTTKWEDTKNAGAFGEGTRMVTVALLAKYNSPEVTFSSGNWKMQFTRDNNSKNAEMLYNLSENPDFLDGNFIEFELEDKKAKEFIPKLIQAQNHFCNSENPDFQEFDVSNKCFSFKLLPKNKNGNLYLIQRFGYNNELNNSMIGMNLVFHELPDRGAFLLDRDRSTLNASTLELLTSLVAKKLSDKEIIEAVGCLKPIWANIQDRRPADDYNGGIIFLNALADELFNRKIVFDFNKHNDTEQYAALSNNLPLSREEGDFLKEMGYRLVLPSMSLIGVPTAQEVLTTHNKQTPLEPTKAEIQKIKLLEEGIKVLYRGLANVKDDKNYLSFNLPQNYSIMSEGNWWSVEKKVVDFLNNEISSTNDNTKNIDMKEKRRIIKNRPSEAATSLEKKEHAKVVNEQIFKMLESGERPYEVFWDMNMWNLMSEQVEDSCSSLSNLIKPSDLCQPKYIFEPTSISQGRANAIINSGGYNGHWTTRQYLSSGDFYSQLTTCLHEMMHQYGDDTSASFSYRMTDLLQGILRATTENPEISQKLKLIAEKYSLIS